ncbi:MAG: carboxypeptidase regulatory-like domain-containing protein [Gammaproteobacteria bacterium]|nr:carboxypeptidase regulatory-like domain-containing protein [Gammaproteobacteria bacterium]
MRRILISLAVLLCATFTSAQQTGSIEGTVTVRDATVAEGIAVMAESDVMPRARTTRTDAEGRYSLPQLLPGSYRVSFETPGGAGRTVTADVMLNQTTIVRVELDHSSTPQIEELVVVGQRIGLRSRAALANGLDGDAVRSVPSERDYRDLVKLAPGVQYTQDAVRGPSAGGSGQDNTYRFDGVDVSLPMFGTLSAEPSSHDIDQLTFERGGASAIGFNRSGGFAMDSTAKSGTDRFEASIEYALAPKDLVAESEAGAGSAETDERWITVTAGGPVVPSQLYFYGSFFAPREDRSNKATAYGAAKDYANTRHEYYGKLTYAPTDAILLNASFRTSTREERGVSVGPFEADSVSLGGRAEQDVASLDGSWLAPFGSTIAFRYGDYALRGTELPDVLLEVRPALDAVLDVSNLDRMGHLSVPSRVAGADAFNVAIEPIVQRHGYVDASGVHRGGGAVGAHPEIGEQAFYRRSFDLTFNHELAWGRTRHDLHAGLRRTEARETLRRTSNGWGMIEVPGGVDLSADGTPIFYVATVQQMSIDRPDGTSVAPINSYTESTSLELNDNILAGDLAFNLGMLISQDVFYGQGLRSAPDSYSGFALDPGAKYHMYTIRWRDMIQPRLGATWNLTGENTLFANFARYNPEANSLARAASWDRNTRARLRVLFDEAGHIIEHEPHPGSSGKAFQDGLTPRRIDEWTVGATRALPGAFTLRAHLRQREGSHFWEDTWNLSRSYDNAPAHIAARGPYVPDLDAIRAEIGGSSYVIAQLDDAYTDYWEAALELEWRGERGYLNASYVRSRYTGNFDQDNTSAVNDANRFIGSSNLADGYGRQLWDNKDGVLRGDRPHLFKAFGYLELPWRARAGLFAVYQSGQPWEAWDSVAYGLPSYFSSTIRYAEPAGSRRSDSHWQLDLSYVQPLRIPAGIEAKLRVDLFNVFDRQTGYNINPYARDATFGQARNHFDPRRVQITIGLAI